MQHRHAPVRVAQQRERVVLDLNRPERRAHHALHLDEVAAEVPEQIEHVHALIEQDPAARGLFPATPHLFEAMSARLAIDPPHPQQVPEPPAVHDPLRFHDPRVVAVVEPELELEVRPLTLHADDFLDVLHRPARRFLAEHVLARLQRLDNRHRRHRVRRRDEHRVHVRRDHGPPIGRTLHVRVLAEQVRVRVRPMRHRRRRVLEQLAIANAAHLPQPDDPAP